MKSRLNTILWNLVLYSLNGKTSYPKISQVASYISWYPNAYIAFKCDTWIGSTTDETPAKLHMDCKILNVNVLASKLHGILGYDIH